MAVLHRYPLPGIAANVDVDGTMKRADAALDAARWLGDHPSSHQNLAAGHFRSKQALEIHRFTLVSKSSSVLISIRMASQAPAGDVEDVLFSMVFLRFLPVVAGVAIDRVRPPAVAAGT